MSGGWLKQDNLLYMARELRESSECMLLWHQALKSMRPKIQVTVKEELHLYKSVIMLSYYPSMLTVQRHLPCKRKREAWTVQFFLQNKSQRNCFVKNDAI
jgi:hypothetical protein